MITNDRLDFDFEKSPSSTWFNCPRTINQHLVALEHIVSNTPNYNNSNSKDCIIYVGGGKYWPGIVVGCQLAREIGCDLPIQVWYRGKVEKINPEQVKDLNVELIDIDEMSERLGDNRVPSGNLGTGGWESKLYALTHTEYTNILFLDADAYIVEKPNDLFKISKHYGMLFWQDLDRMDSMIKWGNVWPKGNGGVAPIQGGQLFINKQHLFPALYLCHWMCQHSDFYFKHLFGDQDCWRVAMAVTKCSYLNLGRAKWLNTAFVCDYNNTNYIVHRCQSKLLEPSEIKPDRISRDSCMDSILPKEGRVFDILAKVLENINDHSVFDLHYKNKIWGGDSGAGSNKQEFQPYINCINTIRKFGNLKSCVDIGCGDGHVASALSFDDYIGYDVSKTSLELFKKNCNKKCELKDCYKEVDDLPKADVLLIRDVLHHWPNKMVIEWLSKVYSSKKYKYIICSQDKFQWHDGQDCYLGGYRGLYKNYYPLNQFPFESITEYLHKEIVYLTINEDNHGSTN